MQSDKTLQWILLGGIVAIIGMISYSSITLSQEINMTLDSLNDMNATVKGLETKLRGHKAPSGTATAVAKKAASAQ